MRRVYLVWVRISGDSEDRIRGMALNYARAEKMAECVATFLRLLTKKSFEYGVKSYEHGQFSSDVLTDDGCYSRWSSAEFENNGDNVDSYFR